MLKSRWRDHLQWRKKTKIEETFSLLFVVIFSDGKKSWLRACLFHWIA